MTSPARRRSRASGLASVVCGRTAVGSLCPGSTVGLMAASPGLTVSCRRTIQPTLLSAAPKRDNRLHYCRKDRTFYRASPMSKFAVIERGELTTAGDFASAIAQRWRDSVVAIIDVGKLLWRAKAALPHGEFVPMIEDSLPFGYRMANCLMAIAGHSIISKVNHGACLPSSWRTVYELTRAPDENLEDWLEDGTIHPEMERKDVLSLLRSLRSSERKSGSTKCIPSSLTKPIVSNCTHGKSAKAGAAGGTSGSRRHEH